MRVSRRPGIATKGLSTSYHAPSGDPANGSETETDPPAAGYAAARAPETETSTEEPSSAEAVNESPEARKRVPEAADGTGAAGGTVSRRTVTGAPEAEFP